MGLTHLVLPQQDVSDWQLIEVLAIISQCRPPLAELFMKMWNIIALAVCHHNGLYAEVLQKWLPVCRVLPSFFWEL